jgi:NAD(P)-dependent dehydrogenase (short-subunit alcohol dehydrogenase family)
MELARLGWVVILHGRDPLKMNSVAEEIKAKTGYSPRSYIADFGDLTAVTDMCRKIVDAEPVVDLLINNAGAGFEGLALTVDGYDHNIQVNFLAPLMLILALRPSMERTGRGRIINVCSDAQLALRLPVDFGIQRRQGLAYARSKLALVAVTRHLAPDLASRGLACFAVHPGSMVNTQLSRRLIECCPRFFRGKLRRKAAKAPALSEVAAFMARLASQKIDAELNGRFHSSEGIAKHHRQVESEPFRVALCEAAAAVIYPHLQSAGLSSDLLQQTRH